MTLPHAVTDLTVRMPEWLTTTDLAELVRCPESTVRYWRHLGTGPQGVRVGRRVLYRREAVDAWLAQREADQHGASAAS